MKKVGLSLFLLCFAALTTGQPVRLPEIALKSDTISNYTVPDSCAEVLPDVDEKWSIADVIGRLRSRFIPFAQKLPPTVPIINAYWFHYRIKNDLASDAKISLDAPDSEDEYYVLSAKGPPARYESGRYNSRKTRMKWGNFVPLLLKAGAIYDIYQRSWNHKKGTALLFGTIIESTDTAIITNYINAIDNGRELYSTLHLEEAFMIGLLLLAAVFTIFFYKVTRENVYIYFALFATFLAINRFYNIFQQFFSVHDENLGYYVRWLGLAWPALSFCELQFYRRFF
ncbi:MAG TPA: hypothetical protein VKR32_11750, partial [Puia sp.]|nr:hypothetical protein [Puia sp.]